MILLPFFECELLEGEVDVVVVVLKEWDVERRFLLVSKFGSIDSSDSFPCAFAATLLLLHSTVLGGLGRWRFS